MRAQGRPHGSRARLRGVLVALLLLLGGPALAAGRAAPPIRHVFILMLENEGYHITFGPSSPAHYLNQLVHQGALLPNYYATSHFSLGNYLTLISGQAPNPDTEADCPRFSDFLATGYTADGQAVGRGCVYPERVRTLAAQLEDAGLSWKGYMEDMGNLAAREAATCGHPAIGAVDGTQIAAIGDQYATRHDPFVYFHSVIDAPSCAQHVVNFRELATDLRTVGTTPNYAFITPNLCHDGHDGENGHCVDGEVGGLVAADAFLKLVVAQILASPAFRLDGLLIITFDEADIDYHIDAKSGALRMTGGDMSACCHEPPGPNLPAFDPARVRGGGGLGTGINGPGLNGPGGGRIGALLLSPFIRPATVSTVPYNHYALLRSVEDLFHLPHLGYAAQSGLRPFGADIFAPASATGR